MNDFRAEALRIYQNTSSTDSNRGVIAALLHLAELLGGEPGPAAALAPAAVVTPQAQVWKLAALERLRAHHRRGSASAGELSRWLISQGFDAPEKDVSLALWDLHAEGKVSATASGTSTSFRIAD
ncbi:hypothetical protein ACF1D2_30100 [Streptomyces bacillaris]|uniref:hypothetical protein n=1 Tax=Streptomyces bacillaris TaxID=68179 RepID=UPI0037010F97